MSMHREDWIALAIEHKQGLAIVAAFVVGYLLGKF